MNPRVSASFGFGCCTIGASMEWKQTKFEAAIEVSSAVKRDTETLAIKGRCGSDCLSTYLL